MLSHCLGDCSETHPKNLTKLQEPTHRSIHGTFCPATWQAAFSVLKRSVLPLLRSLPSSRQAVGARSLLPRLPSSSASLCCQQRSLLFPQLFPSRTTLGHVKDKTGQGKGTICLLGKISLQRSATPHGCRHPCELYVSRKPGAFQLLSSVPFSSWVFIYTGMPEHHSGARM